MIKIIVYDLDGMVLTASRYYTEELQDKFDIPISLSMFSKDLNFLKCKKGEIEFDEFFKPYFENWRNFPKYKFTYELAKKHWFEFSKLDREVYKVAQKLKTNGIINLIATNNLKERIQYIDRQYCLSSVFDIIGSYDLSCLKPSLDFFRKICEKYALDSDEILIFDDKKENINILRKAGYNAEIYKDIADFKKALLSYKVLTKRVKI